MPRHAPPVVQDLLRRYDPAVFELGRPSARLRLVGAGPEAVDVELGAGAPRVTAAGRGRPDALLRADQQTWREIAEDLRGGMNAYRAGRLSVRHDLHLGVGFLAATSANGDGGLRMRHLETAVGRLSVTEAGAGPPVLLIHGLGATKVSFLPTVAALADRFRTVAVDLPGFGDSVKPIRASYAPPFFARAIIALMDALEFERAHVVGNSMGGRVALETGLRYPERLRRIGLLAPSLAWLRDRPWAPLLRLINPRLGLIQPTPRFVVEAIVRRLIPGGREEWTAAGVDEFLRSYLTPRGRAAFYAAARAIYLEEPRGLKGLWTRLSGLEPDSLFIWGRKDPLVPISFARHVREELPTAAHLELDCGHVPQLERPRQTHEALAKFLGAENPT
ncbi:MAG: alpha/beta fold hydrolase [Solirubrobacteraceae bacterium]